MTQAHADGGASVELCCADRVVARYVWDPQLPTAVSPRPYLHPVTTLGGTTVTGFMPEDHLHHLGASVAVPLLNQANFWGGSTYVAGQGPTRLDNHGRQRHSRWLRQADDHLVQELFWVDTDGEPLAREERSLAVRPVTSTSWQLQVGITLRSTTGQALVFDSPGARGRTGAGYGGFFWRAPAGLERVRAFGPERTADVHGRRAPWIALTGHRPGAPAWTLIFAAGADDPWFVRSDDYAGVCSAVAWDRPLVVDGDAVLTRHLSVLVADGSPTAETMAAADAAAREVVPS